MFKVDYLEIFKTMIVSIFVALVGKVLFYILWTRSHLLLLPNGLKTASTFGNTRSYISQVINAILGIDKADMWIKSVGREGEVTRILLLTGS